MKLRPHQRVTYQEAKLRALKALETFPQCASAIGMMIWPDNNMKAQGLGAAASRILRRMEKEEGLTRWVSRTIHGIQSWGWVRDRCADCDACARHAYSDATTAGFFYTKCAKHRGVAK